MNCRTTQVPSFPALRPASRSTDRVPIPRPCSRWSRALPLVAGIGLLTGCAGRVDHDVVPVPRSIRVQQQDALTLDTTAAIVVRSGGADAVRVAEWLAGLIGNTVTTTPAVLAPADAGADAAMIALGVDPGAGSRLGPEGYTLRIAADGVHIDAAGPAGLFYGAQTLRQLLPPIVEYQAAPTRPLALPFVEIEDVPRFAWRGAMLDVARHFFGVEDVKHYIDLLAMYKFNRLHLHLADDQGWRIEIPGWPALTEHGGSTEVGGGPGGFYSTEQYRDLVRYAADRFITIIPEIDMPGHTNAALASVPELNCDGVAPQLYSGTRVGFSALCVESEATYTFVDAVVGHLAEITPGPWIHVGGDEVQELTEEQYVHFIDRVQTIVQRHGKVMVGWGDIAAADLDPTTLIQHWQGGGEGLAEAAPGQVIMSPAEHVYVDIQYHEGTPIGLDWPGLTPVSDAYEWEPTTFIPGLGAEAIVGVEAPMWTETVATIADLEFLAFPRIAAIAEIAWSPESATDWGTFRKRLARQGLRWVALGVNYYRSPEVDWAEW